LRTLALLVACGGAAPHPAADDVRASVRVLEDGEETDPAACDLISDADLRADCSVVVALRAVAVGSSPETACEAVAEGIWRDECRFGAAELLARDGRQDEAAALCGAVRTFRDACAQHLWDPPLAGIWLGPDPSWERMLPPARELHAVWAAYFEETTDLNDRYWRHWFRYGMAATGGPPEDVAAFCGGFPGAADLDSSGLDLRRPCEKAAARAMAVAPAGR
jgi:hypothetical protein